MTIAWFIRHGESVSNANLRTKHPAKSELTPRGRREAEYIVQAFTERPDLIVISPYVRARETAVPTLKHFHPIPAEEWPVHEFTYLHPERYNGTTGDERRPYAANYWDRNDPTEKESGEGESFAELMQRVKEMETRIRQHPANFITVFSHGLFLRAFVWMRLTGIETATPEAMNRYSHFVRSITIPNGGILKTRFTDNGVVQLAGFDTSHMPP